MGNQEEARPAGQQADPAPAKDSPAKPVSVDVELTDDELDKVSGGISSDFPIRPGTPHPPGP